MGNALVPLEKLQFGIEGTPGTLVAADTVLVAENGGDFEDVIERELIEEERGVLADVEDMDVAKSSRLEVSHVLDFEQLLLPLLTGLKSTAGVASTTSGTANVAVTTAAGYLDDSRLAMTANQWVGATITSDGKTGVVTSNTTTRFNVASWTGGTPSAGSAWSIVGIDFTWTITPSVTAPETLKAATFEMAYSDGSSKHVEREFGYGTCSAFSLGMAFNQKATLKGSYFGRASQTSTFTAGQSPLTRDPISSNQFSLAIDDTWAGLGGTTKSNLLRSGTLDIETGVGPDAALAGRTDLDMTGLVRGIIRGSLKLTAAVDADFATEYAAWRARTMRFIRLEALGTVIGSTTVQRRLRVDLAGRYTAPPKFGRQGSIRTAELTLGLRQDATSGNLLSFAVRNALSGF